jgi:hypothetical protein
MSTTEKPSPWRAVEIVYADESTGPAKAAYSGDGWVDVIAPFGEGHARFWVKASGALDLPFVPTRLAKPWAEYAPTDPVQI